MTRCPITTILYVQVQYIARARESIFIVTTQSVICFFLYYISCPVAVSSKCPLMSVNISNLTRQTVFYLANSCSVFNAYQNERHTCVNLFKVLCELNDFVCIVEHIRKQKMLISLDKQPHERGIYFHLTFSK